jgi:AcrR family transcriptional regulator
MKQQPTDQRLLDVAIDHFGRLGLKGANTRAIAVDAGAPMSAITYHFGGKDGLYLAAARHIGERMRERLAPALAEAESALTAADPASARAALHIIYAHMVRVLNAPETTPPSRFIVREQADPTEAFSLIYEAFMAPLLGRVPKLLIIVSRGKLDEGEARLRTIALMGQALVFRVARATAMRSLGWSGIGPDEGAAIRGVCATHLDAILDAIERRAER